MKDISLPSLPPVDELERNAEGYCIAPEGVTVSANGAGYAKGHRGQVYPPGTFGENTTAFTTETAIQAREQAQELAKQRLREAIENMTGEELEQAYGTAGGEIWEQVVRNAEVSGRTRYDVWRGIGEQAGIVEAKRSQGASSGASVKIEGFTPELAGQVRELILLLRGDRERIVDSHFVDDEGTSS